jgi:hypothetical protein
VENTVTGISVLTNARVITVPEYARATCVVMVAKASVVQLTVSATSVLWVAKEKIAMSVARVISAISRSCATCRVIMRSITTVLTVTAAQPTMRLTPLNAASSQTIPTTCAQAQENAKTLDNSKSTSLSATIRIRYVRDTGVLTNARKRVVENTVTGISVVTNARVIIVQKHARATCVVMVAKANVVQPDVGVTSVLWVALEPIAMLVARAISAISRSSAMCRVSATSVTQFLTVKPAQKPMRLTPLNAASSQKLAMSAQAQENAKSMDNLKSAALCVRTNLGEEHVRGKL